MEVVVCEVENHVCYIYYTEKRGVCVPDTDMEMSSVML